VKEKDLINQILIAISQHGGRAWRNNSGVAEYANGAKVRYGVGLGGSDIIGITKDGKFIAVEVKTGKLKLSPTQATFLKIINSLGGIGIEARSVDDVTSRIK